MKFKEITAKIIKEGKKLPKFVWFVVLIAPFGFEVIGIYLIVKIILNKRKKND